MFKDILNGNLNFSVAIEINTQLQVHYLNILCMSGVFCVCPVCFVCVRCVLCVSGVFCVCPVCFVCVRCVLNLP